MTVTLVFEVVVFVGDPREEDSSFTACPMSHNMDHGDLKIIILLDLCLSQGFERLRPMPVMLTF